MSSASAVGMATLAPLPFEYVATPPKSCTSVIHPSLVQNPDGRSGSRRPRPWSPLDFVTLSTQNSLPTFEMMVGSRFPRRGLAVEAASSGGPRGHSFFTWWLGCPVPQKKRGQERCREMERLGYFIAGFASGWAVRTTV